MGKKQKQPKAPIFASVYVVWVDCLQRAQPRVFIALICILSLNQEVPRRARHLQDWLSTSA